MKYRLLGHSGLRVSEVSLGTMTFGEDWGWGSAKEEQAVPLIPIVGARKLAQLEDNLASLDLELSAPQLKSLDAASRVDLGFPQEFYTRELVRTLRYGGVADRLVR